MKILIAAVGTRGDVQPMLALALALRARGHVIRFCAPPNFRAWIASHQLTFHSLGRDFQAFLARFGRGVHRGVFALRGDTREQFEALADIATDVDLILGASIHSAGLSYAAKRGIPYAYVMYSPSMLPSATYPSPTCEALHLPRWFNRLTWWLNARAWNLLFRRPLNRERQRLGLPPVPDAYRHVLSAPLLLAAEPGLARVPSDSPVAAVQTGAWFLPSQESLDPALEAFLAAGPPPVYFGFGSMTDHQAARTFAWITGAARAAGVRAVVSRGWAGLAGTSPDPDVHVVDSVPHDQLFPRVRAVVHHGGAGTTTAAARAGVPQLVIPHFLDQFFWAERVRTLELGPAPVPRKKLNERRLRTALVACLDDHFAQKARTFAPTMIPDGLERAVRLVEEMVAR